MRGPGTAGTAGRVPRPPWRRPRGGIVWAGAALLLIALAARGAAAATRYDPRLHFRTISTTRFDIHFHQGGEALARRLARIADALAADVDATVGPPIGRVQVVLVDQHDLPNGWATPVPYNTIEISVAAPTADSGIGNTDDWLRLVFVHEYTHVAHLSRAGGWIGGLRRVFGRLPLLFPNLYQPLWAIEGIATWEESAATGEGRVPAGDFRLLIRQAAAAGRFEPIDRANGGTLDWPSGTTPYLYGAYFHQYLAARYGAESLRRLTAQTSRAVPYLGSRAYKQVFGRSLGQLWEDFAAATSDQIQPPDAGRAVRLTRHGFNVFAPRFGADGRLFYSVANPHQFPALMELGPSGGPPRRIAERYFGGRTAVAGARLVVDELDLVRNVGLQSDLYVVDPRDGSRIRLTRGARAMHPDVAPDGRTAVCVVQMSDRRALATVMLPPDGVLVDPDVLVDEPGTYFASPRWSPDGRLIAAERRRVGGGTDIVIVNPADRTVRVAAFLPGARTTAPLWTADGDRLLFSAAAGPEPFRIFQVDLRTGVVSRLEGTGASAQSAEVSPDGRTLVFIGNTADGYDLFSLPLADARWRPVEPVMTPAGPAATDGHRFADPVDARADHAPRYSPVPTLVPRFWTPLLESDAGEAVVGAATGALDALGRHAYGIEAGWSGRPRPDWRAGYVYDRWRPTLFAAVSDDTDPWRRGMIRTTEAEAGVIVRVSRVRASHAGLVALHAAGESVDCASCDPVVDATLRTVAVRLGWDFTTARTFGYSISPEEGGRVIATAELPARALGSDASGASVAVDLRRYWRVRPRHGVVAARAAAAAAWGDGAAARFLTAAGSGPKRGGFPFGHDAIGLLRGFGEEAVTGTRAAVVNVDYRVPLLRVDRGAGTVPLFLRAIHGSLFVDAGHAWTDAARWRDLRVSVGTELSADAVAGFVLPVTLTAGGAWRRDPAGGSGGFAAFARIGRAF